MLLVQSTRTAAVSLTLGLGAACAAPAAQQSNSQTAAVAAAPERPASRAARSAYELATCKPVCTAGWGGARRWLRHICARSGSGMPMPACRRPIAAPLRCQLTGQAGTIVAASTSARLPNQHVCAKPLNVPVCVPAPPGGRAHAWPVPSNRPAGVAGYVSCTPARGSVAPLGEHPSHQRAAGGKQRSQRPQQQQVGERAGGPRRGRVQHVLLGASEAPRCGEPGRGWGGSGGEVGEGTACSGLTAAHTALQQFGPARSSTYQPAPTRPLPTRPPTHPLSPRAHTPVIATAMASLRAMRFENRRVPSPRNRATVPRVPCGAWGGVWVGGVEEGGQPRLGCVHARMLAVQRFMTCAERHAAARMPNSRARSRRAHSPASPSPPPCSPGPGTGCEPPQTPGTGEGACLWMSITGGAGG